MVLAIIKGLLTGAGFGIVLYKVGASRYSRVMGMLTLRDTKVMKFAFSAIATASLLYGLASIFEISQEFYLIPRIMPFFGWGHLLGGIIFGISMGWAGFCPGTCVAKAGSQAGHKKFIGLTAILGLITGVIIFNTIKSTLNQNGIISYKQLPMTLHHLLGIPFGPLAIVFSALLFILSFVIDQITHEEIYESSRVNNSLINAIRGEWHWLVSGILGGTLIVLATWQNGYLGFSGALLAFVGWITHLIGSPMELVPMINVDIAWRASLIVGVFPGAWFIAKLSIPSREAFQNPLPKKELDLLAIGKSFVAAIGLSLGAMIGGGCTTGAFLSGWPTLSIGSFAMSGTFFAVSMLTSNLLLFTKRFDLHKSQLIGNRVYD